MRNKRVRCLQNYALDVSKTECGADRTVYGTFPHRTLRYRQRQNRTRADWTVYGTFPRTEHCAIDNVRTERAQTGQSTVPSRAQNIALSTTLEPNARRLDSLRYLPAHRTLRYRQR